MIFVMFRHDLTRGEPVRRVQEAKANDTPNMIRVLFERP